MKLEPNSLVPYVLGVFLVCVPILIATIGNPSQYTEKEIAVLDKVCLCQ